MPHSLHRVVSCESISYKGGHPSIIPKRNIPTRYEHFILACVSFYSRGVSFLNYVDFWRPFIQTCLYQYFGEFLWKLVINQSFALLIEILLNHFHGYAMCFITRLILSNSINLLIASYDRVCNTFMDVA